MLRLLPLIGLALLASCARPDPAEPYMAACVNGDMAACGAVHGITRQEAVQRSLQPAPATNYAAGAAAMAYGAALMAPQPYAPMSAPLNCTTTSAGVFLNTSCR